MTPGTDLASSSPGHRVPAHLGCPRGGQLLALLGAAVPAGGEELPGSQPLPSFTNPQAWLMALSLPCLPDHVTGNPLRSRT